jgi:hypothetical protein
VTQAYAPVGTCIYCGATEYAPGSTRTLAEEHIIPLSIGGKFVLPEASCRQCERVTGRFESIAVNNHLVGPRRFLGLKGRTPAHKRPKKLPIFVNRNGRDEKVMVRVEDHPSALFLPHLANPPILQRHIGPPVVDPVGMFIKWFNYNEEVLRRKYGVEHWATPSLDFFIFTRMLAKIGHAYAVAKLGLGGFDPLLRHAIIDPNRDSAAATPFVGGRPTAAPEQALHTLEEVTTTLEGVTYNLVFIRLFAQFGAPTYAVVAGTKCGQKPPPLPGILGGVGALHSISRVTAPLWTAPPKPAP